MKNVQSTFKEGSSLEGKIKIITTDSITHEVLRETEWYGNLVMLGVNTGKALVLARLNGDNTYSLNITHAEIGTGTTPPTIADVALETPVTRSPVATGVVSGNVLTMQFFFSDGNLPNGTYGEFGAFVDGTITLSSGQIFDRVLFGLPFVKGSAEDTTVQLDITII